MYLIWEDFILLDTLGARFGVDEDIENCQDVATVI
jgi:hypothetical protein